MRNNVETRYFRIEPALRPSPSETAMAKPLSEPIRGMYPREEYEVIGEKLRHLRVGDKITYKREFQHKDSSRVFDVELYRGIKRPESATKNKKRNRLVEVKPPLGTAKHKVWRSTPAAIVDDFNNYVTDISERQRRPIKPVEAIAQIRGGHTRESFRLRTYMDNGGTRDIRELITRQSILRHTGRDRDLVMIVYDNGVPIAATEACDISTSDSPATVETGFDVVENYRGAGISETTLFDIGGIAQAMFGANKMHFVHLSENTAMGHIAESCVKRAVHEGDVPWGEPHSRRNPEDLKEILVYIPMQKRAA